VSGYYEKSPTGNATASKGRSKFGGAVQARRRGKRGARHNKAKEREKELIDFSLPAVLDG
jgi:hypothetical protein